MEPIQHKINKSWKIIDKIRDRLKRFTWPEAVGLAAIAILLLNTLFEIDVAVARRPFLQKPVGGKTASFAPPQTSPTGDRLPAAVLPPAGVELPAAWGDLGKRMIAGGVIDRPMFENLYARRGGLPAGEQQMLAGSDNGRIKITAENSGAILNLLWALGLGNKNVILDKGEMNDPKYGGADKFASTGGWSLSAGQIMDHYSKHSFVQLTADQQDLVDRVSKNIYRPCCGNPTHFPDCNHGMAMLGLLELMASQGVSEDDMYKYALAVNSYWFPDNYLTMAAYFEKQGIGWDQVNPRTALGAQYSSMQGYQQMLRQSALQPPSGNKGGCGV